MTSDILFSCGATKARLVLRVSTRANVMRLRVDSRTGGVVLTIPPGTSRSRALQWVETKRDWVEAMLGKVPEAIALAPGGTIPFRGVDHELVWVEGASRRVECDGQSIRTGGQRESFEGRMTRWLQQQSLQVLTEETMDCAMRAGVEVSRVGVGDQRSRWGSCSSTGSIRYSWRLILAPDYVRRAIVAHEVAHRVHMNHGPEFHELAARLAEGNAEKAHRWLRKHGAGLHRIGSQGR